MPAPCCWGSNIPWWLLPRLKMFSWKGSREIKKCLLNKAPQTSPKVIVSPGLLNSILTLFYHQSIVANCPKERLNLEMSSFPNFGRSKTTTKVMTHQYMTFTTLCPVLTTQSCKNKSPSYLISHLLISCSNCPKKYRSTKWLILKRLKWTLLQMRPIFLSWSVTLTKLTKSKQSRIMKS